MRYLLLSDIHGNNIALEAILNSVKNYDKILVMGDNIGDGPSPDKVMRILKEHNAVMISGNREFLACDHYAGLKETQTAMQWQFMRHSLEMLDKSDRELIASLPASKSISDGNVSMLMVHGSPDSVRELLYYYDTKRLEQVLDSIDEDILLCGHNHYQFAYSYGRKLVINPGSVGLSQKGEAFRADYAVLNVSCGQYSFELNHVHYDGEKMLKEYKDRNMWDFNIWGKIAYREMSEGKMYINGFARYVFALAKKKNVATTPLDDETWLEAAESWDWVPAK